ncbi:alkylation response protein AidB-like acyl-CoA dehydrogenase [Jatrophihabitans sp. GAS493]|uniref:acyl-CoA dehydrogenase family protein n=1 Tax=Jatrophihabitans sp. GAS493 TaxID=1907575 RepID=UPI000BB6E012|nr:acyl-CoA dehydrogenase family protein [Jatrophihabitans sp. GAS493]SOD72111.1 alkylation response protein AidB-like acyl-CoA dehydrogenase [Jatrophihabitans sp. GAS493]
MSTDLIDEFVAFLESFLPSDYELRYRDYRKDEALRSEYQVAAFEAGWLMPEWEPELGGHGLARSDALAIRIEGARRHAPRILNIQGAGVVAPALRQFGSDEQKQRLLRPLLRGEEWWALGMSEPGSGSDLASLRTSALLDGDHFVVNGQKIWTTQAHESRWCTLYVRTDPSASVHAGISCLILDLTSPGVEIRPIRRAADSVDAFCEVFLDEVRIPEQNLLGPLNGGWGVATQSLEHERDMIWIYNWIDVERALEPVLPGAVADSHLAVRAGRLLADSAAIRFTGLRTVLGRMQERPTPEFFILKLLGSETVQRATQLALDVRGLDAFADPDLFDDRVESLGATIYGGTSEIQRNLIAERVLGLPRQRR